MFSYQYETMCEILLITGNQGQVFWFVTPCSDVVQYQHFGGQRCLHLQGEVTQWRT